MVKLSFFNRYHSKYYISLSLIFFLYFLLRLPYLNKELVQEETYIVRSSTAISQTGYPEIYMGETTPQIINLWKPPGLVFILAASFKTFGVHEWSARLVPLIFGFFQALLVVWFISKTQKHQALTKMIVALAIYAVHPFLIQAHTQIDIDGAVYSFFSSLFMVYTWFIIKKHPSLLNYLWWGLLIFLNFSIKFEPTLILLFLLVLFLILEKKYRQIVVYLSLAFIFISTFFLLFYLYNLSFGHPEVTLMPVNTIINVFGNRFIPAIISTNQLSLSRWSLSTLLLLKISSWITGPALAMSTIILIRKASLYKFLVNSLYRYMAIWGMGFFSVYLFFGYVGFFPRYFAPAFFPLIILITSLGVDQLNEKPRISYSTTVLTITFLIVWSFIIRLGYFGGNPIVDLSQHQQIVRLLVTYFFSLFIFYLAKANLGIGQVLIVSFCWLTGLLYWQSLLLLSKPQSLTNSYGEYGFRLAGNLLKSKLNPSTDIVITHDSNGYYYGGNYYDYEFLTSYPENQSQFNQFIENNSISAISLSHSILDHQQENPQSLLFNYLHTHQPRSIITSGTIITLFY